MTAVHMEAAGSTLAASRLHVRVLAAGPFPGEPHEPAPGSLELRVWTPWPLDDQFQGV